MKIASWNINSIRARFDRLMEWLKAAQPDVLCLQETKVVDADFPLLELETIGYRAAIFGQKTYNGVALLSKEPLTLVERNLGDGDEQARVIAGTLKGVTVVGVYAPNGQSLDSPAFAYKLDWFGKLTRWLHAKYRGQPLVVCGDFNVAPEELDVWDVRLWGGQTLFSPREREALRTLRATNGLTDLFRAKHPGEAERFSWWDYRAGAFQKNQGLRIDLMLASEALVARCTAADIDRDARKAGARAPSDKPSDHAPVWAEFSD